MLCRFLMFYLKMFLRSLIQKPDLSSPVATVASQARPPLAHSVYPVHLRLW